MSRRQNAFPIWLMAACLSAFSAATSAAGPMIMGNPRNAGGESFFIQPTSPRENDDIVIVYPQRSCGAERIDAAWKGNELEITINFSGTCLYSIPTLPPGVALPSGGLYRQYLIGRLPVGNYRVRLYYRDLAEGSGSRSFSTSESFAVMPAR
ncbi:MAG TPA: hypothetical protein VLU73_01025 [Methylococcaceae bacterium]|nr:hypothetical protein [Methylococcaceae bacterium]